jgi:Icc protein
MRGSTKFVVLTDIHLVRGDELLFGLNPAARLEAALTDIVASHADAAGLFILGDLAHGGDRDAYRRLRAMLGQVRMPVHLLVGNHDDRQVFGEVFAEVPRAGLFFQYAVDLGDLRCLLLDTVETGKPSGSFCAERQAWLRDELAGAAGRDVMVMMHHPPLAVRYRALDAIGQEDAEAMKAILRASPARIRHLFFGHVHRPISGSVCDIPISATRGTAHQIWLDFAGGEPGVVSHEPPAYAVCFASEDEVVVHSHDFADANVRFSL